MKSKALLSPMNFPPSLKKPQKIVDISEASNVVQWHFVKLDIDLIHKKFLLIVTLELCQVNV